MSQHNSPDREDLPPVDDVFPDGQEVSEEVHFDALESGSDEDCSVKTPEQKPTFQKGRSPDHISETFLSSGNESSDISAKEGSESLSSSSSSDAESGTYMPRAKHLFHHVNGGEVLQTKLMELEDDTLDIKENLPVAVEGEVMLKEKGLLYEELLAKVANFEVELKFEKKMLQASQEEVAKLKYENLTLVEELGQTIEKLQTSESDRKEMEINLRDEFQEGQDRLNVKLEFANQCIDQLQAELDLERRHGSDLKEIISKITNDLNDYSREVEELKFALHDAQNDFSKDKSRFQSEITCLLEQKDALQARVNEADIRQKVLDEQIELQKVEKMETSKLHDARVAALQDEIGQLHLDLHQKDGLVDSLSSSLDASKLKHDTVMAEKDEMLAKLETLGAEINCRNSSIRQMLEQISKLTAEHKEVVAELQNTQNLVEELRLKVSDQEKELEEHRLSSRDRAQEKREAIRQLCFSLEYYRTEYHELRLAFLKHKQPAVLAS